MALVTETKAADWARIDAAHVLHPASPFPAAGETKSLVLQRGEGIWLWDVSGRRYLDAFSCLMNVNIGHGRVGLGEIARNQMDHLAFGTGFFGMSNIPTIELAQRLRDLVPSDLSHFHFTGGGSEANETAFKLARLYFSLQGRPEKHKIISRRGSYHGVTYGALSATGVEEYHKHFGPMVPGFTQIAELSADALEQEIARQGAENVAAFIAEPVAFPSGVLMPDQGYWDRIQAILRANDILLIVDEVITGFGRTGRMFGSEHWNIRADMQVMAKGITSGYAPLGAVGISPAIVAGICSGSEALNHGFTSFGHPVCCAVALANIDIIEREQLAENATAVGERMREVLRAELTDSIAQDVRGIGMIVAVELRADGVDNPPRGPGMVDALRDVGVLARAYGNVLVVGPPLSITADEADLLVEALIEVLAGRTPPRVGS